jgi:DNA-binding MarR family transcriptional regulator
MRLGGIAKACVLREYLQPAGLSVPEWRLIATVATLSPIQFADVTAMSTMDKGQVSRALQLAKSKGYLDTGIGVTPPAGGLDGRSASRVVVTITPAGREIYQQVMAVAQRYQMQLLDLMTADERRVIASLLRRIEHYLSSGAA